MSADRCPTCAVGLDQPPTSDECPIPEQHAPLSLFIDHVCDTHYVADRVRHRASCQVAWRTVRSNPASSTRWIVSEPMCDTAADEYEQALFNKRVMVDHQRLPL